MAILDFFPMDKARDGQIKVLSQIEKAYSEGFRYVIVEAPVGSGKSPMAVAVGRWAGNSHVLTPRKALQDQYYADFKKYLHLMKGRSSYPCVYNDSSSYDQIRSLILNGDTPSPSMTGVSVAEGACNGNKKHVYDSCTARRECPYSLAASVASEKNHVVHNVHGFIFQAAMHNKFTRRGVLIVDECHNLEDICREFVTREISLRGRGLSIPEYRFIDEYREFFLEDRFIPTRADTRESYIELVESLLSSGMKDFVIDKVEDDFFDKTVLRFIPRYISGVAETLIFSYGEKVLLMSGTIYDKEQYCKNLGISIKDTMFIRTSSSFHPKIRPIVMKPDYLVDTSHAAWDQNFDKLIATIERIMCKFGDVKGLIHTPSYTANKQIVKALSQRSKRVVTHSQGDFKESLDKFYKASGNQVFVSPTCSEGVDFKGDRARFQIIVRVPYPSMGDVFIRTKVDEDYSWYNHKALVTFGQQVGRINRGEDDFGVTVLIDSRFPTFINRNKKKLPQWLMEAIVR